ncbi:hypothetical protein NC652_017751 [Populus alba x Populus x berolinensis]|nr:hypothetical protein NC652_017751 [Populus alba x Populus x berolinensis]
MGHMQTARMPMAKRARGQHLTEKSATVEPSKQAENKPFSSPSNANNKSNSNITVTSNYNPSRRLALFQLGTDIPQSQFLSGDLAPARSSEVAEQDVLEWIMKITSMIMEMDFYILVTREPGPVKGGITIIAFVEDPMATSLSSWKEA